jgi:hypothetical protein
MSLITHTIYLPIEHTTKRLKDWAGLFALGESAPTLVQSQNPKFIWVPCNHYKHVYGLCHWAHIIRHLHPKSEIQFSLKILFFLYFFYWISNDKNYSSCNVSHTLDLEFKESHFMQILLIAGLPIVSGVCPNFLRISLKKMKVLCRCSGHPGLSFFKVRMQGSCEGLFFNDKEW